MSTLVDQALAAERRIADLELENVQLRARVWELAHDQRHARVLAPSQVEAMRDRAFKLRRPRDAYLIGLLAYAGLRPGEMRDLRWRAIGERTIEIELAAKTSRARVVRLLEPLARDLREWRLLSRRPDADAFVFPATKGTPRQWSESAYTDWQSGPFREAAPAGATAYALRHSFVSLLLHEGVSPATIAREAGHSIATLFRTYAHVIDELAEAPRRPAGDLIREAREKGRSEREQRCAPGGTRH